MTIVKIAAVCTGQPTEIGEQRGQPVYSGIAKSPVFEGEILLTYTNLAGDQQVDTRPKPDGRQLHGGNEMAVYVYPHEHYALWETEYGQQLAPGAFGENLLVKGILEDQVHIGDTWYWGEAELVVSKPREPCYKLAMYRGWPDVVARMKTNGRCGWYLRVTKPGRVPTTRSILTVQTENDTESIAERFVRKTRPHSS